MKTMKQAALKMTSTILACSFLCLGLTTSANANETNLNTPYDIVEILEILSGNPESDNHQMMICNPFPECAWPEAEEEKQTQALEDDSKNGQ
jgi:hypothetical protein